MTAPLVLFTLAQQRERLTSFSLTLRSLPRSSEVSAGVDLRVFTYTQSWALEMWVEATLDGVPACWWFDLSHDGTQWKVTRAMTFGDEKSITPEDRLFPQDEQLVAALPNLIDELIAIMPNQPPRQE